ncbi:ArnT family glycosyltransferase [Chromobacterium vaccinii]|uniref:ArnT family glycosyltransferase n=1 Tax=Chromobacterium vaccinii TaxID=1108595 RepID=UPI000E146E5D|nr:hypothetical protein [Chromobacterium vaccinii]SUX56306.1 Uncharacterised protein [Chromobacterium vaccinii]
MLTYSAQASTLAKPTEKPWVLLLLCFIWLWPGILGHDPWKPDEPFVLAIAQGMLDSGNWLLPMLNGAPYLDNPLFITGWPPAASSCSRPGCCPRTTPPGWRRRC